MTYLLAALAASLAASNIYAFKKLYDRMRQINGMTKELASLRDKVSVNEKLIEENRKLQKALNERQESAEAIIEQLRQSDEATGGNIVGHVLAAALRRMR